MRTLPASVIALALLAACNREAPRGPADTGLALATSSRAKDSLILLKDSLLASRQRQLAEQGALIGDAVTSARLISEISATLSKVRNLKTTKDGATTAESGVSTASSELVSIQSKVNAVIARLNASEARIRRMRKDSTSHAAWDSNMLTQLKDYEKTIADLRTSVETQQGEIASLNARVDSVSKANVVLAAKGDSLTAVTRAMAAREDSVFVAIGTEDELKTKGIVRREGGTLWFFGRGKTMVPGRNLDMSAFKLLSKKGDKVIHFPRTDKEYAVVSRHDLSYTEAPPVKGAKLKGELRIADTEHFWAPSKYLILVQR